jgi:hypothetical protein
MAETAEALSAQHVLEYAYTRSVGPVIGAFLAGLRDGRVLGIRSETAGVVCPPVEYDPQTAAPLTDLVEVGTGGVVTAWAWVNHPRPNHPLQAPFAWALVRLDGADTSMLHALDAGSEAAVATGMRVRVRWRAQREGHIHDVECFEPER